MKRNPKYRAVIPVILAALVYTPTALSAEAYHQSSIKFLYPLADGSFVLVFNVDSPSCSSTITPKYHYVTTGQNSVNAEGSKKIFAAATLAFALNKQVNIAFDNATTFCYINRITVIN